MKRRDFIVLLGGATAASVSWPPTTGAQASAIPSDRLPCKFRPAMSGRMVAALRQGLSDLGYIDGQTIALEVRQAEGRNERMPELAAELIDLKVDVLLAASSPGVLAAKKATTTIPIVMVAADPIGLGLVASLARPGGNITGLSYFNEAIIAKRVQLLHDLIPGLVQIAVLRNPDVAVHATSGRRPRGCPKVGNCASATRHTRTRRLRGGLRCRHARQCTIRKFTNIEKFQCVLWRL